MGCDKYNYEGVTIMIPEDADADCLCTFPHNDKKEIRNGRLLSLAYLGAAIKFVHEGYIEDDYMYIPRDLPKWVVDGIDDIIIGGI